VRLEADLRPQHLSQDVTLEEQTPYGQKYSIRATLIGPSGSSADVVSVWFVRTGEEIPRLVAAYRGPQESAHRWSLPEERGTV
jgi:hypothetical protein